MNSRDLAILAVLGALRMGSVLVNQKERKIFRKMQYTIHLFHMTQQARA